MKTINEIREILTEYTGGPAVITAAKDLLAHYDRARQVLERLTEDVDAGLFPHYPEQGALWKKVQRLKQTLSDARSILVATSDSPRCASQPAVTDIAKP
jgi:hypothetical protein